MGALRAVLKNAEGTDSEVKVSSLKFMTICVYLAELLFHSQVG
jgi:hypothetical protein